MEDTQVYHGTWDPLSMEAYQAHVEQQRANREEPRDDDASDTVRYRGIRESRLPHHEDRRGIHMQVGWEHLEVREMPVS